MRRAIVPLAMPAMGIIICGVQCGATVSMTDLSPASQLGPRPATLAPQRISQLVNRGGSSTYRALPLFKVLGLVPRKASLGGPMLRREFIRLASGAAASWPLAARAQQKERIRRVGVLLPAAADDAEFQARMGAFLQELGQLGWIIGRNLSIDIRWATANRDDIRRHAAELAELAPDVVLAFGGSTVGPMLQATRTAPIVFPVLVDPVGGGFVESWRGRAATSPGLWRMNSA